LSNFKPDYTASASFTGDTAGGSLKFAPASATLTLTLAPFFVGARGPQGTPGRDGLDGARSSLSADADNALRLGSDDGIYYPGPNLATAQW
jgi:hypothetical protein